MAPDLAQYRQAISISTVPVYFSLAWVLYRRRLWWSYRYFWISLLAEGTTLGLLLLPKLPRDWMLAIYKISQPVMWVLYVLMVREIFAKLFAPFPGIAAFSRRVIVGAMVLAFFFALTSIGGDLSGGWDGKLLIARYVVILRTVASTLIVFLILMVAYLLWMPVPLPPNTVRHSVLFFVYFFITTALSYWVSTNGGGQVQIANLLIAILTLACLLCWTFLLTVTGERLPPASRPPAAGGAQILGQLEALNRRLSGSLD